MVEDVIPPPSRKTAADLQFSLGLLRNYHSRRQRFYELYSTVTSSLSSLLGSAAVLELFLDVFEAAWLVPVAAALVVVLSALAMAVGPVQESAAHAILQGRFAEIERRLRDSGGGRKLVAQLERDVFSIQRPGPPLVVLSVICRNDELIKRQFGDQYIVQVGFWRRLFAPFFDLAPQSLRLQAHEATLEASSHHLLVAPRSGSGR